MQNIFFENNLFSNCNLWSLLYRHYQKRKNPSILTSKERNFTDNNWNYFFTKGRFILKFSIAKNNFEDASFTNLTFDLFKTSTRGKKKMFWIVTKKKHLMMDLKMLFLWWAEMHLIFSFIKVSSRIYYSQTVTIDLSQTDNIQTKQIWIF